MIREEELSQKVTEGRISKNMTKRDGGLAKKGPKRDGGRGVSQKVTNSAGWRGGSAKKGPKVMGEEGVWPKTDQK